VSPSWKFWTGPNAALGGRSALIRIPQPSSIERESWCLLENMRAEEFSEVLGELAARRLVW